MQPGVSGSKRLIEPGDVGRSNRRSIEAFVPIDLIGAVVGAVAVAVVNLVLGEPLLWMVLASLGVLIGALVLARVQLRQGRLFGPLLLTAGGNWLVALAVAIAVPQLWPAMILTVLMPLVLATPYVSARLLTPALAAGAIWAGVVAAAGLLNDDGGALPDLDDGLELVLVIAALMALVAPIALIVWQNNQLQQQNIDRATELNAELLVIQRELADSRRRVVEATDAERRRIERDLHDGAQQRLVALGVRLRLFDSKLDADAPAKAVVSTMISDLEEAVGELRELAHGIYPPLLQSRGLPDALRAVVRRSPIPVETSFDGIGRLDPSIESALYFIALEALTNAAKHAPESDVRLSVAVDGESVSLAVVDDGPGIGPDVQASPGGRPASPSRGLYNMADRVAAVRGDVTVSATPGGGTTVRAIVPLA